MIKISKQVEQEILAHAAATAPHECCGLVLRVGSKQVYQPCSNVAADPTAHFEIAADDWIQAEETGTVVAVVHSHPQGERFLSGADRQVQVQQGLPWLLVVDDGIRAFRPCPHLRGRVFDYGVNDCFTLIRDAYHLAGIEFRDHPRTDIDADAAADSFVRYLPDGGFKQVSNDNLQVGDVVLTAMGGHANHAMLYLGNQEVLHHAYEQLSRRERYGAFWQDHTHSVWRHQEWQPEMLAAIEADLLHSH